MARPSSSVLPVTASTQPHLLSVAETRPSPLVDRAFKTCRASVLSRSTPTPVFHPEFVNDPAKDYSIDVVQMTPAGASDWKNVAGKTITLTAYDKDGKVIYEAQTNKEPASGQATYDIPVTVSNADAVATWGIVIRWSLTSRGRE